MKDLSTWSELSDPHFKTRSVLAFDLDDTLTEEGELRPAVFEALDRARHAGWIMVLVTGRSAGWVDALIKLLPFDAVVGENGALLSFWPKLKKNRAPREESLKLFWTPQGYRKTPPLGIRDKHAEATTTLLKKFPRARVASDQPYRLYDLAIDFAEEVSPPMSFVEAEQIKVEFEKLGAVAKVSSIHVNGWWGQFTKEQGLRELLEVHYKKSLIKDLIYTGDSPNDGPLFKVAGMSVGVANIRHFVGKSDFHMPQFVTKGEGGAGSVELLTRCLSR